MSQLELIRSLEQSQDNLLIQIKWADFAMKAPERFTNEMLQAKRKEVLIELLKTLEVVTKTLEMLRWEYKVMQEHAAVAAALKEFGVPYRSERGVFYLLP